MQTEAGGLPGWCMQRLEMRVAGWPLSTCGLLAFQSECALSQQQPAHQQNMLLFDMAQ